jgi:MOSC domain-containing protein YiiM
MRRFGHMDCGIYCKVLADGRVTEGAHLALVPESQGALPF